jgi:hypothetical protein
VRRTTEYDDDSPIVSDDLPDPSATDVRLQIMRTWITLLVDLAPQPQGNIHDPAGLFDPSDPAFLRRQEAAEEIAARRPDDGSVWR